MKKHYVFLLMMIFVLSACNFENTTFLKSRTIDETNYVLRTKLENTRLNFGFFTASKFSLSVDFKGIEDKIHKSVTRSEFCNMLNISTFKEVKIDSIDISISSADSTIEKSLLFYFKVDSKPKKMVIAFN